MSILNELKRSKIRFSAPSAPRKFWDLEVSHNTPLVSQHLETRGGIMARNSTDRLNPSTVMWIEKPAKAGINFLGAVGMRMLVGEGW